jgi:predicted transglutaminase-like cysteine proteinase
MRIHIAILALAVLAVIASAPVAAKAVRVEPVGQLNGWSDFTRRQTLSMQALDLCSQRPGECETAEMRRWAELIKSLKGENQLRQIITVNKWFNRLPYKYDDVAYNTSDYWAATQELFQYRGDCEDYALSKYYTLRQLGFTPDQLKIVVVYDKQSYSNHAVLMIYINATRYMMDINGDATDPSPMGPRYRPLYSFNEKTAWYY